MIVRPTKMRSRELSLPHERGTLRRPTVTTDRALLSAQTDGVQGNVSVQKDMLCGHSAIFWQANLVGAYQKRKRTQSGIESAVGLLRGMERKMDKNLAAPCTG